MLWIRGLAAFVKLQSVAWIPLNASASDQGREEMVATSDEAIARVGRITLRVLVMVTVMDNVMISHV
jgi:hypothetical protein